MSRADEVKQAAKEADQAKIQAKLRDAESVVKKEKAAAKAKEQT